MFVIVLLNLRALPARTYSHELQRSDSSRHEPYAIRCFGLRARANGRAPFAASLLYLVGRAARRTDHLHMRVFFIAGAYEVG